MSHLQLVDTGPLPLNRKRTLEQTDTPPEPVHRWRQALPDRPAARQGPSKRILRGRQVPRGVDGLHRFTQTCQW